jgi:hypothetical protein
MPDDTVGARLAEEWRQTTAVAAPVVMAPASAERVTRTVVVAELQDVQQAVRWLRQAAEESWNRRLATSRWSIVDVVAHLASWAWRTRVEAEALVAGRRLDEIVHFGHDGPHAWNQREVERRRQSSLDELVDEIDGEHERLIELVASVSDVDADRVVELPRTIGEPMRSWHMSLAAMILMTCWHSRLHLNRVRQLLDGNLR